MGVKLPSAETILSEAIEIASADERAAYLDRACGEDAHLRRQVESLLEAHFLAGPFLESPAAAPMIAKDAPPAEGPGTVIGPYKLLEQIGEGGMGSVYMAEQAHPVRRRVALKVIKPGMDTRQVIARFEAERQALALMDHPNIARVLDAGATESGRPYFVMELVRGIPITDYCDQARLTISQRLELFVLVCRAVQHAHQKGIIHRDLKPSNILITLVDGAAVPKIIDFGVAKAMGQQLTEKTLFTAFAQMVGTPLSMSPEQVELAGVDIDTRSDIYSLGVLLYELLTGTTPIDRATFRTAAWDEIRQLIREQDPPKPSTRLSGSRRLSESSPAGTAHQTHADASDGGPCPPHESNLAAVAAQRQIEPAKLVKVVRGELDWIVMKCLEKDRRRRYETAGSLAADIQRHLSHQPVEAGPPSGWYRFAKFARRNRVALTTGLVVAGALIVGTAVSTWQAFRATKAERQAQALFSEVRKQRDEAEDQRDEAKRQTSVAQAKSRALQWQLYINQVNRAQNEWTANNVAEAEQLLDACPPALRGWEWRYVKRLCHLGLLAYTGHLHSVSSVAFSPDGTRVVSGGSQLAVWDAATGRETFIHRELRSALFSVAFHPDGRAVASGDGRGDVTFWDAATGQEIFTCKGAGVAALSIAFSPDGRYLVVGFGAAGDLGTRRIQGHCKCWDVATGTELWSIPGPTGGVQCLALSPDGTQVALAGLAVVELWDLRTRQRVRTFRGHADLVYGVAFSPDGRRLASTSKDDTVRIWNQATGSQELILHWPSGEIRGVAFSPDGRSLAAGSQDRSIKLWDASTGEELAAFRGHANKVNSVAFSPDGKRLVSAGAESTVRIWDVRTSHPVRYRIATETKDLSKNFGDDRVIGVVLSPDGRRLAVAGSNDLGVSLWDRATGARVLTIQAPRPPRDGNPSRGVAFSPDGRTLAISIDPSDVKLYNAQTGQEIRTLHGHTGSVKAVAYSPDGTRLASGGQDGTIRLWDAATGREARTLTGPVVGVRPADGVISVAFSRDGRRLAAASGRGEVFVWDVTTGSEVFARRGTEVIHSVALSPDGSQVVRTTGYGPNDPGDLRVYDVASGREVRTLRGHTAPATAVAYSPDGTRLASASRDKTIKLWDVATGAVVLTLRGHTGSIRSLSFSGDGHLLASGAYDGTARLWDASPLPAEHPEISAPAVVPPSEAQADRSNRSLLVEHYGRLARNLIRSHDRRPGDPARAVALARQAVETDSDNPSAMNLLAWLLATCPDATLRDPARAVALAQKAVKKEPQSGSYWNTLGIAHYRAGDWKAAIEALEKSMELRSGGDSLDWFFLAMAQWQKGEKERARTWYDKSIAWMNKNDSKNEELNRFRAEAAALLGLPDPAQGPAQEKPTPTLKPG